MKKQVITFTDLTPENKAFVKQVLEKNDPMKVNRNCRKYIDKWIMCQYDKFSKMLARNSFIIQEGRSSIDMLNDVIEKLYYNYTLSFKSQEEADEFLNNNLRPERFVIPLREN